MGNHRVKGRVLVVAALVTLLALLATATASATNIRYYVASATSSPSPLTATSAGSVTVSLKNCSSSTSGCDSVTSNAGIGSASFTFPAGFTVTGATVSRTGWSVSSFSGNVVKVKGSSTTRVGAGSTLSVTVNVTAPSTAGPYTVVTAAWYGTDYVTYPFVRKGSNPTVTVGASPSVLTTLSFDTQPPASVVAGEAFDVTVKGVDQNGAGFAGASVTLGYFANPNGNAALSRTAALGADGKATFEDVVLTKAGGGTRLQVSAAGVTPASSDEIDVLPGPAASIAFSQQPPASIAAGGLFPVTVSGVDDYGNAASGGVTISVQSGPGALAGSTTGSLGSAINGLQLTTVGAYTLRATHTTSSSVERTADSTQVVVTAGTLASLAFVQQPTSTTVNTSIAPAVTVSGVDAYGNPATGSASLTLGGGTSGAVLTGGGATTLIGGVATFSGLKVNVFGLGYTLVASSGAVTSSPSLPFNVLDQAEECTNSLPENGTNADTCKTAIAGVAGVAITSAGQWSDDVQVYMSKIAGTGEGCFAGGTIPGSQSVEVGVVGSQLNVSQPLFTLAMMLKKQVLQSAGYSSRNASTFDICLGARRLDGGSGAWITKSGAQAVAGANGYYYGLVPDCSALAGLGAPATNPCIVVKTKNEGAFNAAAGQAGVGLGFKSSDMGIVLKKPYPWDGKAGWP